MHTVLLPFLHASVIKPSTAVTLVCDIGYMLKLDHCVNVIVNVAAAAYDVDDDDLTQSCVHVLCRVTVEVRTYAKISRTVGRLSASTVLSSTAASSRSSHASPVTLIGFT